MHWPLIQDLNFTRLRAVTVSDQTESAAGQDDIHHIFSSDVEGEHERFIHHVGAKYSVVPQLSLLDLQIPAKLSWSD